MSRRKVQAAHNIRTVLVRHGWMANFIGYRRSLGPNELVHLENSPATLAGADLGLDLAGALRILMAVETYVLGFAQRDQQELRVEQDTAKRLAANPGSSVLLDYPPGPRSDLSRSAGQGPRVPPRRTFSSWSWCSRRRIDLGVGVGRELH